MKWTILPDTDMKDISVVSYEHLNDIFTLIETNSKYFLKDLALYAEYLSGR